MTQKPSISIVGSGNVAHSLSPAILDAGYKIDYIFSRNLEHAKNLATPLQVNFTDQISDLSSHIILIAVSDSAIEEIAKAIPQMDNQIVAHTAGSQSINIISQHHHNAAVFYPLQTFSASRQISFSKIPVCVEASNKSTMHVIAHLARSISENVHEITSDERLKIHTAAVFACNYTNLMYTYARDILSEHNIPFDILKLLISETAEKAINKDPASVQTGPAIRNDHVTIDTHMQQLSPDMASKYKMISEWIKNRFTEPKKQG